jgi:hypothetical protein
MEKKIIFKFTILIQMKFIKKIKEIKVTYKSKYKKFYNIK